MTPAEALVKRARRARFETEVASPCVSICRMDLVKPLCEGCFRTLDEIAAWSRVAYVSADGRYVALGYSGSNLLSLGVNSELAMITFYQDGAEVAKVPLSRLMPDLKLLRRSASHWVWGEYIGFAPGGFRVKTVDGRILTLDPATGSIRN